jgi:hypothetical protein
MKPLVPSTADLASFGRKPGLGIGLISLRLGGCGMQLSSSPAFTDIQRTSYDLTSFRYRSTSNEWSDVIPSCFDRALTVLHMPIGCACAQ